MTSLEEPIVYTTENRQEEMKSVQDATEFWMQLRLFPEIYGQHIDEMMKEVGDIEEVVNQLEEGHALTPKTISELLDQLRIYPEKILRLDENAEKAGIAVHTEKREALVERMAVLRKRLMEKEKNERSVRDVYRAVKTRYDAVQHTLTLDQRREMRTRIATLSSLVRHAEDERLARVGSAVLAAVSHATEHAPAIAHAAVASIPKRVPEPQKKGPFASLIAAFRLK